MRAGSARSSRLGTAGMLPVATLWVAFLVLLVLTRPWRVCALERIVSRIRVVLCALPPFFPVMVNNDC